ncbi:MAG: caspase family protein, partial [Bacteroidota bacterium]
MSAPQFYGLFVGIDTYLPPVPPLDGCVNDMRAMRDYIKRSVAPENLHLEVLENEQATRMNVIEKFKNHLTQAGENDIAFFYFSGHGSQEPSHEAFAHIEQDEKNETIVCYDSRSVGGSDLADKELATLIDQVTQKGPHFLVIMDCCNSGDGTRSLTASKTRQTAGRDIPRPLDAYILPRNINSDRSVLSTKGTEGLIVPTPRHVQMSAAHSFELAKETYLGGSPRGVFTYSLIEVLESAVGPMTYSDLMRRVRRLVTQRTYEQTPQLYSFNFDDADLVFLGGSTARKANYYGLSYDRESNEWSIDAGSAHGIIPGNNEADSILNVFAEDANENELEDADRALGQVSVKAVDVDSSTVRLEGPLWLDKDTQYRAVIFSMPVPPMYVSLLGDDAEGLGFLNQALDATHEDQIYLRMIEDINKADYVVHITEDSYIITRGTDGIDQPLIAPVSGHTAKNAEELVDNLIHIAKWERILELKNPSTRLPSNAIKVTIMDDDQDEEIKAGSDGYSFSYKEAEGAAKYPKFRVKLTNQSSQRLYVAFLYMGSSFGINPGTLPSGGLWLDPGQESWIINGNAITASVDKKHLDLGRKQSQETFKLIVSTTEIETKFMRMKDLGEKEAGTRSLAKKTNTRSLMFDDADTSISNEDW